MIPPGPSRIGPATRAHRRKVEGGRTARRALLVLLSANLFLALALWLTDWSVEMLFVFPILSLLWNLAATFGAWVALGRDWVRGFLIATGLVSLASFGLCASLGFAR